MRITVSKQTLLAKLTENREKHQVQYAKAVEGFKLKALKELRSRMDRIEQGDLAAMGMTIQDGAVPWREWERPRDETKQYDRAIKMLRMSQDESVELSESDFEALVLDRWEWSDRTLAVNSRYAE